MIFTAKTSIKQPGYYLSVKDHHLDAACVARMLIASLPEIVVLQTGLDRDVLSNLLIFVCMVHDIGKLTALFQGSITKGAAQMRDALVSSGFAIINPDDLFQKADRLHHTEMGYMILNGLAGYHLPKWILNIVCSHHGRCPSKNFVKRTATKQDKICLYGRADDEENERAYRGTWKRCIEEAMRAAGYRSPEDIPVLDTRAQLLITGAVVLVDWISSNTDYFPLVEELSAVDRNAREKFVEGILKIPGLWLPDRWTMTYDDFEASFGFTPNEFQKTVLDVVNDSSPEAVLTLLEGSPGCGKTEGGFAASEIMAARTGAGGLSFSEPTQATSNAMFSRVISWIRDKNMDDDYCVNLAHSAANMAPQFAALADNKESGVYTSDLFSRSKISYYPTFTVGTWDSILAGALQMKHFMVRIFSIAGKVCVFDEIHETDAYTEQVFLTTLYLLGYFKIPTLIISATISTNRKKDYIRAYMRGLGADRTTIRREISSISDAFPSVTTVNKEKVVCSPCSVSQHKKYKISRISETNLEKTLVEKLKGKGCAAVVVNTVKRSQKIFDRLCNSKALEGYTIILDHSYFLPEDRSATEDMIIKRLGKNADDKEREKTIIVGTKAIQVSLDYDVDYMVTELCSIADFFQRLGRLFRHNRIGRPINFPEVAIMLPEDGQGEPYTRESAFIYSEYILRKTYEVLGDEVVFPDDIKKLLNLVETTGNEDLFSSLKDPRYKNAYENSVKAQKDKARHFLLNESALVSGNKDGMEGLLDHMEDTISAYGDGAVRDIKPTLTVSLMGLKENGNLAFLDRKNHGIEVDPCDISEEEVFMIASSHINLPLAVLSGDDDDRISLIREEINSRANEIAPGILQKKLFYGKCLLILNEKNEALVNGYKITYDNERGLLYEHI